MREWDSFTQHILTSSQTKMSEEELVSEELEAQRKQLENKRKRVSDAQIRKANKAKGYA
jgi:hypothetical protein